MPKRRDSSPSGTGVRPLSESTGSTDTCVGLPKQIMKDVTEETGMIAKDIH